ncbi:type II toxin-antitoxin system VapB family antitoxin [Phyllobacterium sp. SB3]|uniref:type II toxin-antitoxin system VapB family antitoxin n=1 Tax=Phyllobacterium sp. SB3 TaxID=3156073 RepID=UPI0032AE86F5
MKYFKQMVVTVNLQIRDPRAHELARQLAEKRKTSLTEAVIEALQAELQRENHQVPLSARLAEIADRMQALAGSKGREMTKDEIDAMWGHN